MIRRVLIITDVHLRDVDFKTLKGYKSAVESLFMDTFIPLIDEKNITDVIYAGDLVDKGYRVLGAAFAHEQMIRRVKEHISNHYALVLGNHFFIEMLSNPELYWIQPHPIYKPIEKVYNTKPLLETPDKIIINKTQISLFHYNKTNKNYTRKREAGINYHIGIYHDDVCVPISVRKSLGITAVSSSTNIFDNIDLAIHGHIHTPQPVTYVNNVPQIIPGSCSLTSSDEREYHTKVLLPIIEIGEETATLSYAPISIGVHKYRLMKKKAEPNKQIRQQLMQMKEIKNVPVDNIADFIRSNNLPVHYIPLIRMASNNTLSIESFMKGVLPYGEQQSVNFEEKS